MRHLAGQLEDGDGDTTDKGGEEDSRALALSDTEADGTTDTESEQEIPDTILNLETVGEVDGNFVHRLGQPIKTFVPHILNGRTASACLR